MPSGGTGPNQRALAWAAALVACGGCGFDSSGLGAATHGVEDTTAAASGSDTASGTMSPGSTSSDATSVGDAATTQGSASGSSTTGVESTTGGDDADGSTTASDPCDPAPFYKASIAADQAMLDDMVLDAQPQPIGPYAYSEVADQGQATFTFVVDCPGTYSIHGLVYDSDQLSLANADSFEVAVDDGGWHEWPYGCQVGLTSWRFRRVRTDVVDGVDCLISQNLAYSLEPGTHTVTFRNLESGSHASGSVGSVAALARIVITNDPLYTPTPGTD